MSALLRLTLSCDASSAAISVTPAEDIERLMVGRGRRSSGSQTPPLHFSDSAVGYLCRLAHAAARDAQRTTDSDHVGTPQDEEVGRDMEL